MKKLIIIHGADSFLSEESYLSFLSEQYIPRTIGTWEESNKSEWKKEIAKKWTINHGSVYMPTMPNKQRAMYRDWKMLFEELIKNIDPEDEVTLIGNSLGGCFFLKYFSECSVIPSLTRDPVGKSNSMYTAGFLPTQKGQKPLQIDQIHLLAACISEGDFTSPDNYEFLQQLGSRLHIWHAEDDAVVPFSIGQEISRLLPQAKTHFFPAEKGYGHFHGVERIPELEDVIFG